MKQCHDSSDDDKFPAAANKTLSEKSPLFIKLILVPLIGSESVYRKNDLLQADGCLPGVHSVHQVKEAGLEIPFTKLHFTRHILQLAFYDEDVRRSNNKRYKPTQFVSCKRVNVSLYTDSLLTL